MFPYLVLDQRDEGRHHNCDALTQQGWQLVAQAFPCMIAEADKSPVENRHVQPCNSDYFCTRRGPRLHCLCHVNGRSHTGSQATDALGL